jgi:amidase
MPTKIDVNASWTERSRAKKASVLDGVPAHFIHDELQFSETDTAPVIDAATKFLSTEELLITSLDAVDIVAAVRKGEFSAVKALDAFTHRAAIAHKLLNCCLEFRYEAALGGAQELDAHLLEVGSPLGQLHGLPVSVKDQCRIYGTETTCGFVAGVGVIDKEDSTLVQIMKKAGAVIFVKTNLSFGCLWGETINK